MTKINFINICNEFGIDVLIALENAELCALLDQIKHDPKADEQVREFLTNNF